jgi:hypothetical protein
MSVFMKRISSAMAIGVAMLIGPNLPAQAGYVVTLEQVGNDVVATGSGTIDLTGLFFLPNNSGPPGCTVAPLVHSCHAVMNPGAPGGPSGQGQGLLITGSASPQPTDYYLFIPSPNGAFGTGGFTQASSGNGDTVGISHGPFSVPLIIVPAGYVSDSPLSDTAIYDNQTFSSLGVTPGTYENTLANGDSFIIVAGASVPEPSSFLLLAGAVMGLAMLSRRRVANQAGVAPQ